MPIQIISRDRALCRATSLAYTPFIFDLEQFPPLSSIPTNSTLLLQWLPRPRELSSTHPTKVDDEKGAPNKPDQPKLNFRAALAREASNITAEPAKLCSFNRSMEIPMEVRERIWHYAMQGERHPVNKQKGKWAQYLVDPVEIREFLKMSNNVERPTFLPPMCRISKSTMAETIGVYVRGSNFMVASINDNRLLDGFLRTVDKGYEAIRSIHFAFFDCFRADFPQNADLELAFRCKGLHTIRITFHIGRLRIFVLEGDYEDGLTGYPRPVDDMWAHYRFDRLMDCKNLQEVIIELKGRYVEISIDASENLGNRIKQEYKHANNRDLNIVYDWA